MRAVVDGTVIAEAPEEELIRIEGNWYFPPDSVAPGRLVESATPYTCPWKGECQYFTVTVDGHAYPDAAWSYPEPLPTAIEKVGRDFSGYLAFWREVEVVA